MNAGERIKKIEELLEKFQTNHWPHMTGRVARMEGMLAVLLALTLAVELNCTALHVPYEPSPGVRESQPAFTT